MLIVSKKSGLYGCCSTDPYILDGTFIKNPLRQMGFIELN